MKIKNEHVLPIILLIIGMILVLGWWCMPAHAQDSTATWTPDIEFDGPSYFATAYGDGSGFIDNAQAPNARARIGFTANVTRKLWSSGPVVFRPVIGFSWEATRWPIGSDSSPIGENNQYSPNVRMRFWPGGDWSLFGVRLAEFEAGWWHDSNGQDDMSQSASMNRAPLAATLVYHDWLQATLTGWYLLDSGGATRDIGDYINFAKLPNLGGQVRFVARFDYLQAAATLGLTSQDLEAILPLQEEWAAGIYLWLHNGEADGIVDPASDHTSGGAGLVVGSLWKETDR